MTAKRIVLVTGATGGIGAALVAALMDDGHAVFATGRDPVVLEALRQRYISDSDRLIILPADLTQATDMREVIDLAGTWRGGIDVLINNAGSSLFGNFEGQSPAEISQLIALNLTAPMVLTQALLPTLRRQSSAHLINVGSVFGAIGYPGYAAYCASKFGLRGMTESLRRELADTKIQVHLVAPRATRTAMNNSDVEALNRELGNRTDSPEQVAKIIVQQFTKPSANKVIGFPEGLFARLNALIPSIVDRALHHKLPTIRRYAKQRSHS
jgi:short-subunit dehydrogenase